MLKYLLLAASLDLSQGLGLSFKEGFFLNHLSLSFVQIDGLLLFLLAWLLHLHDLFSVHFSLSILF